MTLLQVPNEILLLIAEDLSPAELNSLCQTNRRLASLLTPLLHNLAVGSAFRVVALHWGAATGNEHLVKLVMEKGVGIIVKHSNVGAAPTVLYKSSHGCGGEVVRLVMEKRARIIVQEENDTQRTSLHWAIMRRQDTLVRTLLEKGAPANVQDFFGATTLHYAAAYWDHAPIELLVAKGADIEAVLNEEAGDAEGQTALQQAVEDNNKVMIRQLLKAGADIGARDFDGRTALHMAVTTDDISLVRLLLENGASLDTCDYNRNMPLDLALPLQHRAVIMLLLSYAGRCFRTHRGETALHLASAQGYKNLIGRLLNNEIDINVKNRLGQTALHWAVSYENYEIAKMLMLEGADYEMVDLASECTALDLARANGKSGREMVQFILRFGAKEDRIWEHLESDHRRRG